MAINLNTKFEDQKLKIADEKETRKKLINLAKNMGFEQDLIQIFNKYDNLIKNCTNEKEKLDIGKLGAYEVYNLIGRRGNFYINNELIYKDPYLDNK